MTKRIVSVLLAVLCIGLQAFAQNAVSGKVTDASGEPIIGASVMVKGTTTGAVTDLDGAWSIASVKPNSTLLVSCIGYGSQEVKATASVVNIVLTEDTTFLEEVVVVGYGTAKRKDLTGSISQMNGDLIAATNNSSATKALEGAIPGLVYASVDGQPGADAGIRVRGLGSTNAANSNALVVIDGVPVSPDVANPLSNMNAEDIASVTVLKDAASTAIYGSRGANGVVLVTTKSGKEGRTKVSFQGRWGVNTAGSYKNGQIDDAAGVYEWYWQSIYNSYRYGANGSGGPVMGSGTEYVTNALNTSISHEEAAKFASMHLFDYTGSTTSFGRNALGNYMAYKVPGAIYTPSGNSSTMTGAYLVGLDGKINPDAQLLYYDPYSANLLQNGFRQQYDVSASGGNEKENHYVSFGYLSDPSYVPSATFDRISGRANVNFQAFDWLKIGTNISFNRTKTNYQAGYWGARNGGSHQGSITRFVNGHSAIIPFHRYDENGNMLLDKNGEGLRNYDYGQTYSPLGQTANNYGSTDVWYQLMNDVRSDLTMTLNTRSYAEVNFLKHFQYRFDFAYDFINKMSTLYYNGQTGRSASKGGHFAKRNYDTEIYNIQNRLTYNQDFGKHHVDALALFEYDDYHQEYTAWGSSDEFIPGFLSSGNFVGKYQGAGQAVSPSYSENMVRMMSYLARANYIYDERYYASASLRRDGSSKFRAANRWGTFWSVGAGWRFTGEKFMESTRDWLTNGKLRASYGVIGNQNGIGYYQTYRTWNYGTKYTQTTNGNGTPTGSDYTLSAGSLVNTALTWEETGTFDVGLDLTFIDRISVTLDYYNRITANSQFNKPVSRLGVGQDSLPANIAEITNNGVEFDINAEIIRKKDWRWTLGFNASHYDTKLTGLPAEAIPDTVEGLPAGTWEAADGGAWSAAGGIQQSANIFLRGVGRDYYNMYMFKRAGVDQSTGLPLYYHKVTEADHAAGRFTDTPVGGDAKTNNYAYASKYEVGDALPELVGGFNTMVSWKGLALSMQFAYQLGGKFFSREYAENLYNVVGATNRGYRAMMPSKKVVGNTWTPDNTGAEFPMQWYPTTNSAAFTGTTVSSGGSGYPFSDAALFSASYLRLKNVTLSYTLPKSALQRAFKGIISNIRVFASADNLFLLSAAKSVDPTMSACGGYNDVDLYLFPNMRTFTFGVNLDF